MGICGHDLFDLSLDGQLSGLQGLAAARLDAVWVLELAARLRQEEEMLIYDFAAEPELFATCILMAFSDFVEYRHPLTMHPAIVYPRKMRKLNVKESPKLHAIEVVGFQTFRNQ